MYSLGVLIWRMVTGSRPWGSLSNLQITVTVGMEGQRLSFPDGCTPGFEGLQDLALRCMASDPAARPTAEEACSELEGLKEAVGGCLLVGDGGV